LSIMERKKVFIASSKEANDKGFVSAMAAVLTAHDFEPHPWSFEFPTSVIILERLFEIANAVDFAICLFTEDMQYLWRGETHFGTAWNVVLEYGIFLQKLGKERVTIIRDGKAHIPTDLGGLVVGNIGGSDNEAIKKDIAKVTSEVVREWRKIPSLHQDLFGVNTPIVVEKARLEKTLHDLTRDHSKGRLRPKPIHFDETLIIELYVHGLKNTRSKFWTTTYLSSGFWVHKTSKIFNANVEMLERLRRKQGKDIKRLFLLKRPLDEEMDILNKKLIDYKNRKHGEEKLKDIKDQYFNLYENCLKLKKHGCEIRYAHDIFSNALISEHIAPGDTEIAIYDDFRIDFYGGAKTKKISSVTIYTNQHLDFGNLLNNSNDYFEQLWSQGSDIDHLLLRLEKTLSSFERRVDYTIKKLMEFDNDLNVADASLKRLEQEKVLKYLNDHGFNNKRINSLDIGTCTGRYPLLLKRVFGEDSLIYGIDSDHHCLEYIRVKKNILLNAGNEVGNIEFYEYDFLVNREPPLAPDMKFDVITCMLGTVSHFGWGMDNSANFRDNLQRAFQRMKGHLTENGVLIISNWSNNGLQNGLLSIYNERDRKLLKDSTEWSSRMKQRLNALSLKCEIVPAGLSRELDIFFCTHE
jgi:SAM-dependent methyltransferase